MARTTSGGSASMDIEILGDNSGVQKMLRAFDTALNPVAIAGFLGAVIDPYVQERAENRFRNEGDDVVGKWTPLSPATEAIRSSQGYGGAHPINKRTGELERYITSRGFVTPHPFGATLDAPGKSPGNRELRNKVKVAQQGDPSFGRGVPARPVMGLNWNDMGFILSALAFHVKSGGRRSR